MRLLLVIMVIGVTVQVADCMGSVESLLKLVMLVLLLEVVKFGMDVVRNLVFEAVVGIHFELSFEMCLSFETVSLVLQIYL